MLHQWCLRCITLGSLEKTRSIQHPMPSCKCGSVCSYPPVDSHLLSGWRGVHFQCAYVEHLKMWCAMLLCIRPGLLRVPIESTPNTPPLRVKNKQGKHRPSRCEASFSALGSIGPLKQGLQVPRGTMKIWTYMRRMVWIPLTFVNFDFKNSWKVSKS